MSNEILESIILKLNEMDKSNKQEFAKLNDKVSQIDKKIDTIYTQVANNTEHQTMVELDLKQIKQQTSLDQKVTELETELKLIKRVLTNQ